MGPLAVVALAEAGAGTAPLVLAAAVEGYGPPPVGGLLRQLWPRLVEPADLVNGYAIDSLLMEKRKPAASPTGRS